MNRTRNIKHKIIDLMHQKNVNTRCLSKKTGIPVYRLYALLHLPFLNIKLTQSISISTALGVSVSNLF